MRFTEEKLCILFPNRIIGLNLSGTDMGLPLLAGAPGKVPDTFPTFSTFPTWHNLAQFFLPLQEKSTESFWKIPLDSVTSLGYPMSMYIS